MSANYKDYGWSDGATNAHSYLYDTLMTMLSQAKDLKILDVGCGNGEIASRLLAEGYDVYGIDASQTGIEIANKKNPGRFFVQDVTVNELPDQLKDIHFDLIISTEVVEHLYAPRSYIQFCKMVLKSSDSNKKEIIISTPYHGYLKNLMIAIMGGFDKHFTVLWDGGHIKFWSRATLTSLLHEAGFNVTDFQGSGRLPFLWKSMFVKAKLD